MLNKDQINSLPSEIGVYFFKKGKEIIYIGKSINIKARVKSHIENAKLDKKESLIVSNSDRIESTTVDNEFQALILESELIKKHSPKYNVIWKDGKSYLYIKVTIKEEFPKVLLSRKPANAFASSGKENLYFGPFSSTRVVESLIYDMRRVIPFCTEKKLSKKPCFYSKIGLCNPCPNGSRLVLKRIYRKNIKRIIKILRGGVTNILNDFYKQLNLLTKEEKYEKAIIIRNKIFRMERLINHPTTGIDLMPNRENNLQIFLDEIKKYFPSLSKLGRIECYDISNLGEANQVGSMVVMTNGSIDKKQYRRFRINSKLRSDFDRLNQVINRRFKNDWPIPDLIIVDGGKPQVRVVLGLLERLRKKIPVLGIAKHPDRLVIGGDRLPTVRFPQTNPAFNIVRLIRDESHRFANKYHRHLRRSDFLV